MRLTDLVKLELASDATTTDSALNYMKHFQIKWLFARFFKEIYHLYTCIDAYKEHQPGKYGCQHRSLIRFNISLK